VTGRLELGTYRDSHVSPLLLVERGGSLTVGQPAAADAGSTTAISIYGRGAWIHAGQGLVHGDLGIGESTTTGDTVPRLTIEQGGHLQVTGHVVAGTRFASSDGALRAEVVLETGSTLQTGGALVLNHGTQLSGSGTVQGLVEVNGGTVSPGFSPGHLTILGDLRIGVQPDFGTSTLRIELGNASAPGASYDVLDVSGLLELGDSAVLEVRLLPGFNAAGSYEFLRFGTLATPGAGGESWFGAIRFVDAGGGSGQGLDFQRDGGRVGLHLAPAVPEPASALLMLLGAAGLLARRRLDCRTAA
jgi:PEP-CTERM motif